MEVTKVDILKKEIAVRDGTPMYWEAEFDPANIMMRTQGEIPDQVTVKQNAYQICEVFANDGKGKRYYAVRLDDRQLFTDLIEVSNGILEAKLAKAREENFWDGERKGYSRGYRGGRELVKSFPWWKRLFKKF